MGTSGALDMLLTGRRLSGQEAHQVGLVSRLVPKSELFKAADEIAHTIAGYNQVAVRSAKQAVTKGMDMSLEQGLDLEWRLAESIKTSKPRSL